MPRRLNASVPAARAAQQQRAAQAASNAACATAPPRLTTDEILAVIGELGGLANLLSTAKPQDRAGLYDALGIAATYDPGRRTATLEIAIPRSAERVGGPSC